MKKIFLFFTLFLSTHLLGQCVDTVWIPSAFSPNGLNKDFYPVTPGNNTYQILIFNRSGNLVSECNNEPWNGSDRGSTISNETYVYLIRIFGEQCSRKLRGIITLIN